MDRDQTNKTNSKWRIPGKKVHAYTTGKKMRERIARKARKGMKNSEKDNFK
jgi:nucleoid DNA-binding protein